MLSVPDLEAAVDKLGNWLLGFTAVVVIGLMVEYGHDLLRLIDFGRPFDRARLRTAVGGALITLGVAGELVIQADISSVETQLRAASDRTIADLNKAAADANARAAEAIQKAEEERSARVKLEQATVWRDVSPEQRERILSKCKVFAGQQYVTSLIYSRESGNFSGTLDGILQEAGWVKFAGPYPPDLGKRQPKIGVEIQVAPSREADLGPVALAVATALMEEGITAYTSKNQALDSFPAVIAVNIDAKVR